MVNVYIAGGSTGNSLETTVVQLAADALGVRIEDVNTIQGDTSVTGFGAGTGGSRSASMTAGAIRETAVVLRERIIAIAAHKLEAAVEDIELADSRRERPGHAVGRESRSRSSPTSPTSGRTSSRPAARPGSRRARGTPRPILRSG